jgi:hypothetical protein
MPSAKRSIVGSSDSVMWFIRSEMASGSVDSGGESRDRRSDCWVGSRREESIDEGVTVEAGGGGKDGMGGWLVSVVRVEREAWSLVEEDVIQVGAVDGMKWTYCAICCSSSLILAAFWTFFGFGFLIMGIAGGGASSCWELEF